MHLFFICLAVYSVGCVLTMAFFLVGRSPVLIEQHNRPWPIIFLWPLLIFWPVHALAGYFIRWKTSRPKKPRQFALDEPTELAQESVR